MDIQRLLWILITALAPTCAVLAQSQRNPEVIQAVLRDPIPETILDRARQADDEIMRQGSVNGTRVYLITDERHRRVNAIVGKLLTAMGERQDRWLVRVLDTKPTVVNAFVTGGRYIYACTGFLQEAQSDDEIAFVLGHEIGHSMLKHGMRQEEDPWMKIAKIAAAIGAARGGGSGETLAGVSASLQVQHSQADELEADAIGTAIAWRAGYDVIRGADFFTRSVRRADEMWSDADRQLEQLKTEALQSRANCEQLLAGWNGGRVPRNPQNQQLVNAACADAEQKRLAFNDFNSRYAISKSQENLSKLTSTHPDSQARISAIAAGLDALEERRDTASLKPFPHVYNVLVGLHLEQSVLVQRQKIPVEVKAASSNEGPSLKQRLTDLKDALDAGLVTTAEYESKRAALLEKL